MTDKEILKKARCLIKQQYMVELKWLVNDDLKLDYDNNKIESLACNLTKGIEYIRFEGHDKNGIFIRKEPNFELKITTIALSAIGLIATIIKYLFFK